MKKKIALLLAIAMLVSLSACGNNTTNSSTDTLGQEETSESENTPVKDTLTVAIVQDPGTMYPYGMLSSVGRMLFTPVYEALFFYDENTSPVPVLVDTYDIDEDGMGITLKLKEGILFHDGSEMKANDVLFSLDCILASNWASNIGAIDRENCAVIDEYTVYLHWQSVQGPLLYELCNLYILSESYMTSIDEEDWTFNCIGTGPYMWGTYSAGTEYHLLKFDGYREEKAMKEITVRILPDSSVQTVEMETGNVDIAMGITYKDLSAYAEDENDGYSVTSGPLIGSFSMTASYTNEVMQNEKVCEALACSLNLEAINQIAYAGMASPATNIFASGINAWEAAENQHTYDIEYAKQLLIDAGYPDGVTIDLYIINTTTAVEAAEIMINSCAEAGITLNVIPGDTASMAGYMYSGAPGFYMQTLYTNGDPYIMLSRYDGKLIYKDVMNWGSMEEYDECNALYAQALTTLDEDARIELYREIMQLAYDKYMTIPVLDIADNAVHPDNLEGFWIGGPAYHYEDAYWN